MYNLFLNCLFIALLNTTQKKKLKYESNMNFVQSHHLNIHADVNNI